MLVAALLPLVWACASSGSQQTAGGRTAPRHDPYVITAEELAEVNASNLYEAIRNLRPQWLETRAPTTFGAVQTDYPVLVFMDRIRFGTPDQLRTVPLSLPQSVRWMSASQAQGEFGVGNLQGVIQVITRRNP